MKEQIFDLCKKHWAATAFLVFVFFFVGFKAAAAGGLGYVVGYLWRARHV